MPSRSGAATAFGRAVGSATTLAAALVLAGCSDIVVGKGEASDEVAEITSMTPDQISERLPDEDFYGDASIESDPSDPYRGLCLDVELPDAAGADAVVRFVEGTPDGDLDGSSFITDETIYVFSEVGAASEYHTSALEAADGCPADEENESDDTTYSYAYETGDVTTEGWHGREIAVSTTVEDPSDSYDNAEIRVVAQRGNAVAYISWLVRQVDDINAALDKIRERVDDYLVAAGG